jgi:orotidine-5'-phosphate decarboxylase
MIQKLISAIQRTDAPIVVGLDPKLSMIPDRIKNRSFEEFGQTPEGAADALWQFNKELIDNIYDVIPAVKPQIAMYEQLGIEGLIAFKKTVDYCHDKGLIVIGDIKRGDIGSTSESYAIGHLGSVTIGSNKYSGFNEDFATVNPYLGSDGVKPFIDVCNSEDKGIFVLVKTSNPSSGEFQDQKVDGKPLYELVGEKVNEWAQECREGDYSQVGAVVGATYPEMGKILRDIMPNSYILVPGYGAQGGSARIAATLLDKAGGTVNSSRGILCAWKKDAELASKIESESLTLQDIADSAARASLFSKQDLLNAKKSL